MSQINAPPRDDDCIDDDYSPEDEPYCICDLEPTPEEADDMTCDHCGKEICP